MNRYEEKQEARRQRYENLADKAAAESDRRFKMSGEGLPPMGEPIKVGHHSEKRHRAAIARSHANMDKFVEEGQKAAHYERKAASVGKGGISSDDPEAVEKLKTKLESLQASQEMMKAANKALRKGDDEALKALGFNESRVAQLKAPDFCGRVGFPDYALTNNNGNMRRIKQRIASLEQAATAPEVEPYQGNGFELVENQEANRIQFIFDGKPSAEIRQTLKSRGFRWAPSEGAWQRQLNNAGRWSATEVVKTLQG